MFFSTLVLGVLAVSAASPEEELAAYVKRFSQYGSALKAREDFRLAWDFMWFSTEVSGRPGKKYEGIEEEATRVYKAYSRLCSALQTDRYARDRRNSFWELRQLLTEEEYKAGRIPPPVPPAFKEEFEKWVEAERKRGARR